MAKKARINRRGYAHNWGGNHLPRFAWKFRRRQIRAEERRAIQAERYDAILPDAKHMIKATWDFN